MTNQKSIKNEKISNNGPFLNFFFFIIMWSIVGSEEDLSNYDNNLFNLI